MPHLKKRWESLAGRIAVAYAAGSLLWIVSSDLLFGFWAATPVRFIAAGVLKGSGFVLATALMLYLVINRLLRSEFAARTQAEQSNRQLTELQSIAEHSNDLLYQQDLQHRIVYISPRCKELVGYTPAELYADWRTILPDTPLNRAAVVTTERALQTGEKQPPYLIDVVTRAGQPLLMEVDESPLKDADGRVVGIVGAARNVTERKAAEKALLASEARFRALYESMTEGLALHEIVLDSAGQPSDYRILAANPAFSHITGMNSESVVGRLGSEVYRCSPPPYLDVYAGVASGARQAVSFEIFYEPFGKHLSVSAFSPSPGQFATVFSDISKRKEAERQICLLNQVYSLLSNINEAIVRSTSREVLLQEACRISVLHGEFKLAWIALLQPDGTLQPVAWAGTSAEWIRSLFAENCGIQGAYPACHALTQDKVIIRTDGPAHPICAVCREHMASQGVRSSLCLPLKTEGKTVGVMCVYSAEPDFFSAIITESLIEVATNLTFALGILERNRQRETEQQQMLLQHTALEAAANAIVITNRSGRIEWVNEAFTRLTGYSRQEVVGGLPAILKSGAHRPEFYAEMWRTVLAGKVWQGRLINRRKDGREYDEEMTITPVRASNGQVSHFIAIKQDITERKRLEQQFLRAQRMQSIGLLAGGVAHDLNNVLAPVMLALPLLRSERDPSVREQILQTLEQSVKRGANIVKQVLTFARGVEVQRAVVQLKHLIREVVRIVEETFPRDIQVRCQVPADLWPLQADPTQIHQVLLNLAVNARDAMPDGGTLTISGANVQLTEPLEFQDFRILPGHYVNLSVRDTGVGMAADTLEHIFEPFFTTKPVGKGTGLGLSTVLGIVKSHNGLVQVKSEFGRGSTFSVYLPSSPGAEIVQAAPTQPICQGNGETVLVVDDEPAVLNVTQAILERNGYRVLTARDGQQAVSCFTRHRQEVQLVLTDVMMPLMDGISLTRSLREMNAQLPIIAATGLSAAPGDIDRSAHLRELGVRHFLRKPFESEQLLDVFQTALRESRETARRA